MARRRAAGYPGGMRKGCRDANRPPAADDEGDARRSAAVVDTTHIATPGSLALLRAWDGWRGTRLLPSRADMTLSDIAPQLPFVVLLELRGPDDAHIRLAGTALCAALGQELKGQNWLALTPPEARAMRAARLQHLVGQPCAAVLQGTNRARSGMEFRIEQLALPVRPVRPTAPMQILAVISLLPGQPRPSHVAGAQIGQLPDQFRFLDIGAGLPMEG
jgi:hypothetical protein